MNLQKIMISLAFTGLTIPGMIQVGAVANQANKCDQTQAKAKVGADPDPYPFNPKALVHQYTSGDDYYAYYANTAFKSDYPSFGYVAHLGDTSVKDLLLSYNYGVQHQQNALGSMFSFVLQQPYAGFTTVWSNRWIYNGHFSSDATIADGGAMMKSFEAGDKAVITKMAKDALQNHQVLALYISTTYETAAHETTNANVRVVNLTTGANYTTPWATFTRYPFNPSAFVHSYHDLKHYQDYYAYYANTAFEDPLLTYGYVVQLSSSYSVPKLMDAYNWGQEHYQDGLGGMITYLIDMVDFHSPYSNDWDLSSHFADAKSQEGRAIFSSFKLGDEKTIVKMVNNAISSKQTLNFFFFTKYLWKDDQRMAAKVEIVLPYTQASYTTPWVMS